MKTTALTSAALILVTTASLAACSGGSPSPTSSTPPPQTQTMGALNSPAFAKGVAAYNAVFALPRTETLPPEASKYATQVWIDNSNLTTKNFWTKIAGGPATKATGQTTIGAWKPVKLYLDGPSQPPRWSMIMRACIVAKAKYYSASGKVIFSGGSSKVATLSFRSLDGGSSWKIADSQFQETLPQYKAVTVPCKG